MAAGDAAVASDKVMALVEDLSKRVGVHDAVITDIVKSIRQLVEAPDCGRSSAASLCFPPRPSRRQ